MKFVTNRDYFLSKASIGLYILNSIILYYFEYLILLIQTTPLQFLLLNYKTALIMPPHTTTHFIIGIGYTSVFKTTIKQLTKQFMTFYAFN